MLTWLDQHVDFEFVLKADDDSFARLDPYWRSYAHVSLHFASIGASFLGLDESSPEVAGKKLPGNSATTTCPMLWVVGTSSL